MSISFWQIAIVVALIVLLFGRGKISELMGDVAKGITSFKKGLREDVTEAKEPEAPKAIADERAVESEPVKTRDSA
ncbi:MAG: twin-arginine translocase TatA/TatE family subunit, partial [Alphaproteobacteria bacterium]